MHYQIISYADRYPTFNRVCLQIISTQNKIFLRKPSNMSVNGSITASSTVCYPESYRLSPLSNKGFPCSQHSPQLLWETQSFRRRLGLGLSARAGKTPPPPPFLPSWLSIFSIATSCYFSQLLILAEVRRSSFEFRGLYKIYMCFCCVELGEISVGTFLRLFSIESFQRLLFIVF